MIISLYSLPSLGASLALGFILIFSIRQGGNSRSIKVFYSIIVLSLLYVISEFFLINSANPPVALFWDKAVYLAAVLIVPSYLHLTVIYPRILNCLAPRQYLLLLLYLPAMVFICLLFTDLFIAGVQPAYWGWGKVEGPYYNYFRLYLLLYFLGALWTILIKRRHAEPAARNGLTILGLAYLGPILIAVSITQIFQRMGYDRFNIMAIPISMILFGFVIAYAILRQHLLFDMQLLLAPAIKTDKYRFHQRIKALIHKINRHDLDYKQIVAMLQDALKCAVGLNINGQPVAASGGDAAFTQAKLADLDQEIAQLNTREDVILHEAQLLSRATFENFDKVYGHLEACGIEAILPLYDDGHVLGTVKFGEGFFDKIYSKQDFELITALWSQLVVALKYIRKLEEQMAVKDRVITKLKRKIRFLQTDFRSVGGYRETGQASPVASVWISNRQDGLPPIDNCAPYSSLRQALSEKKPAVVIVDGNAISNKVRSNLRTLKAPLVVIGRPKNMPIIENNRLVDHVPADQVEERLGTTVRFMSMLHQALRFQVNGMDFVSDCPQLVSLLARIEHAAPHAKAILLGGETGTGKEMLAARIGQICGKNMVNVNCAAIADGLFESAFFGHEKGAFTGASRRHQGYLEQARGGILFLDEISELPLDMQAKLLRILEGGAFQRVGGHRFIQPGVQFIFASNRNLKARVKKGLFREDLLYRLDQLAFNLPPLRQRKEDIPLLAGYYLMRHKLRYGVDAHINAAAMAAFKARQWPGNVRELSNAVLKWLMDSQGEPSGNANEKAASLPEKVKSYEAALIQESLEQSNSKSKAAGILGIPVSTLRSKLQRIDLHTAARPAADLQSRLDSSQNLADQLNQYELLLIEDSLKRATSQSEAARKLGIPLSTLRSKLKKNNIAATAHS